MWNFKGSPSDSASTFFKMSNACGNSLYDVDFEAVITKNDC